MGIGDLLVEQLVALRRDLGVYEKESGVHNSGAVHLHRLRPAVGGNTDCDPEQIAVLLYDALPEWIRQ